jgi:hypothetical protein
MALLSKFQVELINVSDFSVHPKVGFGNGHSLFYSLISRFQKGKKKEYLLSVLPSNIINVYLFIKKYQFSGTLGRIHKETLGKFKPKLPDSNLGNRVEIHRTTYDMFLPKFRTYPRQAPKPWA